MNKIAILAFLLCCCPGPAFADFAEQLYGADVEVSGQEADVQRAAGEALSQVLIKVTGNVDIMSVPALAALRERATLYVQRYGFVVDERDRGRTYMHFQFDPGGIAQQLKSAGAPLWTANRPSVLVWLVAEDADGRSIATPETHPELFASLRRAFARRGVPLRLPLFDLQDLAGLSAEQVWQFRESAVRAASARYGVAHILIGRMASLTSGSRVGDWVYLSQEQRESTSVSSPGDAEFALAGVALAADTMAARYASVANGQTSAELVIKVSGLDTYAAYAAVVDWLEKLEVVDYANVSRLEGSTAWFGVGTGVTANYLATVIGLNSQLEAIAPELGGGKLEYIWRGKR